MNNFDEQVLQHVRALKAIREKFLAAPNRKVAMAGLPKLEHEDYAAVVESWPKDYDRILNGESATMLAMDAAEGRLCWRRCCVRAKPASGSGGVRRSAMR